MTPETFTLWAGYTQSIQCSYQETQALLERLDRFHHHPLERARLEKKARMEGPIYHAVVFTLAVGPGLRRVRLRS